MIVGVYFSNLIIFATNDIEMKLIIVSLFVYIIVGYWYLNGLNKYVANSTTNIQNLCLLYIYIEIVKYNNNLGEKNKSSPFHYIISQNLDLSHEYINQLLNATAHIEVGCNYVHIHGVHATNKCNSFIYMGLQIIHEYKCNYIGYPSANSAVVMIYYTNNCIGVVCTDSIITDVCSYDKLSSNDCIDQQLISTSFRYFHDFQSPPTCDRDDNYIEYGTRIINKCIKGTYTFINEYNIIFISLLYNTIVVIANSGIIFIAITTNGVSDTEICDVVAKRCTVMCTTILFAEHETLFITLCNTVFIVGIYDAIFIPICHDTFVGNATKVAMIYNSIFAVFFGAMFGIICILITTDDVIDIAKSDIRFGRIWTTICQAIFITIYGHYLFAMLSFLQSQFYGLFCFSYIGIDVFK